jgi:hypothetical protein
VLKASYHVSQSRYTNSQHFMGNHVITVDDADHAHGVVYAFVHQELQSWYFTEWENKPVGPHKMRYPGRPPTDATLPDAWPSWAQFWSQHPS